jgi:hypothetical protein
MWSCKQYLYRVRFCSLSFVDIGYTKKPKKNIKDFDVAPIKRVSKAKAAESSSS